MKKNLIILFLAIIVLAIIIILTNQTKPVVIESPMNDDKATVEIEKELDTIDVDANIDAEMKIIDQDLETL